MDNTITKIAAGALIPSFATIVFNLLNFFFENYKKTPLPEIGPSTYDIAAGCVFSMIGICVAVSDHTKASKLFAASIILILVILSLDMLAPALLDYNKFLMIMIANAVSFTAVCWAIRVAG